MATLHEYLLTLFRLEERARAFFVVTIANVLAAIALTVVLVVGEGEGARGLLLGSYVSGAAFVLGLIVVHRRRLSLRFEAPLLRRMLRFGLPTMPAELSLYALNFVDRIIIVRTIGLAEAGLYSLAVKFAQGVNVLVRGFQLAWPPLAYSIRDDDEARRTYATVITLFLAACPWPVVGLWLLAIYLITFFTAAKYHDAYEVVGLVATGVTLYSLYMVMVVILGRTGRTEYNLPAALAALISNIALNGLDWHILVPLLIGSVPGAILGSHIAPHVKQSYIRRGIVIVLTMSGLALLDKAGWAPLGAGEDETHPLLIAGVGLAMVVVVPLVWGLLRKQLGMPMFGAPTVAQLEAPEPPPGPDPDPLTEPLPQPSTQRRPHNE